MTQTTSRSNSDGELEVALVVRRHRHDRAGAVAHEHVVGDEDRDARVVHRVDREGTGEDAGLLLALGLAFEVALLCGELAVAPHGVGRTEVLAEDALPRRRNLREVVAEVGTGPVGGHDRVDERMLGREHHVGGAEEGVRARREDRDDVLVVLDREVDRRTGAAPDPVALHLLDGVRPVEQFQIREQAVGVRGDAQHPLLQQAPVHGMVAALTAAVGGDLLVREDGAERRTPVDRCLVQVREPEGVDQLAATPLVEIGPAVLGIGLEHRRELGDRTGPIGVLVVPAVEDLQEDPLRPAVVGDVGRGDAPTGVVAESERAQLAAHGRDVRLGGDPRVLARLHRVLLRRQAERVVAHRVQDVLAAHAGEPGVDVGADVAERVADVETGPAGVREHVQDEERVASRDPLGALGEQAGGVRRPEGVLGVPPVLPAGLDVVRQARVVPVGRGVVGHRRRGYRSTSDHSPLHWTSCRDFRGATSNGPCTHDARRNVRRSSSASRRRSSVGPGLRTTSSHVATTSRHPARSSRAVRTLSCFQRAREPCHSNPSVSRATRSAGHTKSSRWR